jgi:hypothetical protein
MDQGECGAQSCTLMAQIRDVIDPDLLKLEQRIGLLLTKEVTDLCYVLGTLSARDRRAAIYVLIGELKPILSELMFAAQEIRRGS